MFKPDPMTRPNDLNDTDSRKIGHGDGVWFRLKDGWDSMRTPNHPRAPPAPMIRWRTDSGLHVPL